MNSTCTNGHLTDNGRCNVCDYLGSRPANRKVIVDSSESRSEPEIPRFPCTDAGNAELFNHLFGDRVRYDHRRKRWLDWGGHCWQPDVDDKVVRMAKQATRVRYQNAAYIDDLKDREAEARWAIQSENRLRIDAVLALAKAEKPIADAGDSWDSNPWLLAVANGVLDLTNGRLRPGRQDDCITTRTQITFDPAATCPRWELFVNEIFGSDDDLIDYVWRAAGYSLTGDTGEQCHFICWGPGANGKTTFQRVQREVLGEHAANTPFSTLEINNRNAIPNDLAALYGKRLVTASELNESIRLNEARLKMLAGEDPVTARFLHSEFFTFVPVAKFWLSVNHKPVVNDDSTGYWRKIRLIPFVESFEGRADKELKAALRAEYPGILAWMVRGCVAWQDRGLTPPDVVRLATENYRTESDPLAVFLIERCLIGPGFTTRASDLYKAYQRWADDSGLKDRERLSSTKFGRLISTRFQKRQTNAGNSYIGIGLNVGTKAAPSDPEMEGSIRSDPPFSDSSLGPGSIGNNQNNPPQPSTQHAATNGNPPSEPPPTFNDPPRCVRCGIPMSSARIDEVCGRCNARG